MRISPKNLSTLSARIDVMKGVITRAIQSPRVRYRGLRKRPGLMARLEQGPLLLSWIAAQQRVVQHSPRGRGQVRGGLTHSYVASTVFENLGILVKRTSSEVPVLSPLGQSVWASKLYRDVPLEVQGSLVKHRVCLDCATKRVVLRTEEDDEVVMIGEHLNHLTSVISALVAKKLCFRFRDSSIKDIRTVRDILDVFPEELQGLPLNREVEFWIELLSGIAPVSITPYRLASKELTELKAQL
ncbi:alcohol-forming fatty acyl-CoA reductase-like [Gossypium australe]|uniref:Alcohol-forming fatty acyl-CoA reductase-like n=1 Tax=Gossypium australe TaxID=47621 RepID=A0A5B6X0M5_9ROSI|nr:alcohol-forming fatty acyl-CoA reductase-like [Gossypium australe]